MKISHAEFLQSCVTLSKCPPDNRPEYAFIGRSNVGKSSLINMLARSKKLAKISNNPGKTQTINHFLFNKSWYLVDLPGYGYAKISQSKREDWKIMIGNYLKGRRNLMYVFVLIDSRIPPQKIDMEFIGWLGETQIPFVILHTKTDKISDREYAVSIAALEKKLLEEWEELPLIIKTSSLQATGKEDVLELIEKTNIMFEGE